MKKSIMISKVFWALTFVIVASVATAQKWQRVPEQPLLDRNLERHIVPKDYKTYDLATPQSR